MDHQAKIDWMIQWAHKNKCILALDGECGFGRECVGILRDGSYPDYHWHDEETWARIDGNGDVWIPPNAYHKHACVAVLGRGEEAESQLYDWLTWFDSNGFTVQSEMRQDLGSLDAISLMLHGTQTHRMVKKGE